MSKLKSLGALIILTFLLAACGNNDQAEEGIPEEQAEVETTEESGQANDSAGSDNASENQGSIDEITESDEVSDPPSEPPYEFKHFSLEADVEGTRDAIEVEYEHETDETEASYKDNNGGVQLAGDDAMEELDSIFSEFNFDSSTPEEEVAQEVAKAFNVPDDAEEVELEIEFTDDNELDYERS
ncbi:YusW family protein [Virgibacillus sediminis]|uniref:YusW family protein n=1 Tax=Virgibacillus sediminis TaxID=202260 RepID=A0ABV7A1W8_9BACI